MTWIATGATFLVCTIIVATVVLDRGAPSNGAKLGALVGCGFLLVIWAFDLIGRASDAPHRLTSGPVQIAQRLPNIRHSGHRLLLCFTPCETSPRLYMHDEASDAFERGARVPNLTLGYLLKSEEAERGVWVYEVVDIVNAETGYSYYHRDTDRHPFRIAFLFGDALLVLLTGVLCARLAASSPVAEENTEIDPEALRAMPSELTSIHLTDAESRAENEK